MIWTSPDRVVWQRHETQAKTGWMSVAWNGIEYLAVGAKGALATSADGANWLVHASLGDEILVKVIWAGTQYVAVGQSQSGLFPHHSVVLCSTDGLHWVRHLIDGVWLWSVAWNGSRLVGIGEYLDANTGGVVLTSEDGVTWTPRINAGHQMFDVTWADGRFVVAGSYGLIGESPDGIAWSFPPRVGQTFNHTILWTGSYFIVLAQDMSTNQTTLRTSTDLQAWTVAATPGYYLSDVIWADGAFVAVGSGNVILASQDGVVWSVSSPLVSTAVASMVYGGGQFVAVGGNVAATSPDGVVWTVHPLPSSALPRSVVWTGTRYVAVGYHCILTSEDGVEWTPQALPVPDVYLMAVAWNGTNVLAVGPGTVFMSPDGLTWTAPATTGFGAGFPVGLTWHVSKWVGGDWGGELWMSADGAVWTKYHFQNGTPVNSVVSNGSLLVAVGDGDGLWTSADGETWTSPSTPTHWGLNAVTFAGSAAVAVGDVGVILDSPDGLAWNEGVTWLGSSYYCAAGTQTRRAAGGYGFVWRDCGATADLGVSVAVDNGVPRPGDPVVVSVTLTNSGPIAAGDLLLAASMPAGLTYSGDDGSGAYDAATGDWAVSSLAAGASATLRISATASGTGVAPFTAELMTSNQADPDSTPGNHDPAEDDQATVNVIVACAEPDVPAVSAPATVSGGAPYLVTWSATSPDGTFDLQEATDATFSDATTTEVTATSRSYSHLVGSATLYYYRVRSKVTCDGSVYLSDWSAVGRTQVGPPPVAVKFYPVTPCRVVDTRTSIDSAAVKRGDFLDDEVRAYTLSQSTDCPGLPTDVTAWSLNIQLRPITQPAYLLAFPDGVTQPAVSTLVARPDRWRVNSAIVPAGAGATFDVYCQYASRVVIDVSGYFAP